MPENSRIQLLVPIVVAIITGTLAGIPAILTYINTPRQIESEIKKLQLQHELQIKLQRDQEVAKLIAKLDEPTFPIRSGAALALATLGTEEIVPILVGKLIEASRELGYKEINLKLPLDSPKIDETRRFIDALKQSLLSFGIPALRELVKVNRDLRLSEKQQIQFELDQQRLVWGQLSSEDVNEIVERNYISSNRAKIEIKDLIRRLFLSISGFETIASHEISPIAQNNISLSNTDLYRMNLRRVNFGGVDLKNADLRETSLAESNLKNANLQGALLYKTSLYEANLEGANFKKATLECVDI